MGITILPPSDSDSEASAPPSPSISADGDPDHAATNRPSKRLKSSPGPYTLSESTDKTRILVPGETITTEPQWMRGHGTTTTTTTTSTSHPGTVSIKATLPGPLHLTNKLLSIIPLRSRYIPSIGDLVLGRIVSVDKSRWRVDIAAPLLAQLPLSSINLPGGVLRRRTTADELQMRAYFQEGDLVVAEVQGVGSGDGTATLHTRSLRYGKLRNGVFMTVKGSGGGLGVVRGKRQVFVVERHLGPGGRVEVALGVNGFVWVSGYVDPDIGERGKGDEQEEEEEEEEEMVVAKKKKKTKNGILMNRSGGGGGGTVSISNLDELVSNDVYSSQNDEISPATRAEITRVCGCIELLVEAGVKVDEETVLTAYQAAVEEAEMEMEVDNDDWRDRAGEVRKRIVQAVGGGGVGR